MTLAAQSSSECRLSTLCLDSACQAWQSCVTHSRCFTKLSPRNAGVLDCSLGSGLAGCYTHTAWLSMSYPSAGSKAAGPQPRGPKAHRELQVRLHAYPQAHILCQCLSPQDQAMKIAQSCHPGFCTAVVQFPQPCTDGC